MDDTPNLKLPYILAAQSQKHVTHNEALRALDAVVQLAVLDKDLATPPGSPANGDRYLVAASPTGAWAGHATHVAAWQDGAWAFYAPVAGWLAWVQDESQSYLFSGGGWIPAPGGSGGSLVPRGAWSAVATYATGDLVEHEGSVFLSNIDDNIDNEPDAGTPASTTEWTYFAVGSGGGGGGGSVNPVSLVGVNATADTTNRLSVSSPATLFDHEGAGHQLKINKDDASDTASVLFQTDYSGRAEFGLAGDDDFHVKVSSDGSAWHEALVIDRTSGALRAKSGETDVASAATCNIGAAAAQRVRITGTTTITSFGTSANELRHLVFAGALTLTHHATSLILPGGANIATAAGDTAVFTSDASGNWRCLSYQRANGRHLNISPFAATLLDDADAASVRATLGIGAPALSFRNRLMNSAMVMAQRGATIDSATTPANTDDSYCLDRWNLLSDGNDVVDITQNTADAPADSICCIRLDVETTNKKFGIAQFIEARNCRDLIGGTVTLSFKAKVSSLTNLDNVKCAIVSWSGTADTLTSDMVSAWGAEGTNPTLVSNWTYENTPANLGVTTSWATYSVTAAVDTASTKNVAVFIWSDVTTTATDEYLYLTDVQLEAGTEATAFERRSFGVEEVLCQRYFLIVQWPTSTYAVCYGHSHNATSARLFFPTPVPLRSTPSLVQVNGSAFRIRAIGITATISSFAVAAVSFQGAWVAATTSGLTEGETCTLTASSAAILLDAEL